MITTSQKLLLIVATRNYPAESVRLVPGTYVILEGVFEVFVEFEQYDELESEPDNFVSEPICYIEAAFLRGGRVHFCYRPAPSQRGTCH